MTRRFIAGWMIAAAVVIWVIIHYGRVITAIATGA